MSPPYAGLNCWQVIWQIMVKFFCGEKESTPKKLPKNPRLGISAIKWRWQTGKPPQIYLGTEFFEEYNQFEFQFDQIKSVQDLWQSQSFMSSYPGKVSRSEKLFLLVLRGKIIYLIPIPIPLNRTAKHTWKMDGWFRWSFLNCGGPDGSSKHLDLSQ